MTIAKKPNYKYYGNALKLLVAIISELRRIIKSQLSRVPMVHMRRLTRSSHIDSMAHSIAVPKAKDYAFAKARHILGALERFNIKNREIFIEIGPGSD